MLYRGGVAPAQDAGKRVAGGQGAGARRRVPDAAEYWSEAARAGRGRVLERGSARRMRQSARMTHSERASRSAGFHWVITHTRFRGLPTSDRWLPHERRTFQVPATAWAGGTSKLLAAARAGKSPLIDFSLLTRCQLSYTDFRWRSLMSERVLLWAIDTSRTWTI